MKAKDENTSTISSSKQMIFRIKKLQRKGLLEKKEMIRANQLASGKWTPEEEAAFISSCYQFGPNWNLIKDAVKTRTKSQIRSHAQKYMIKLCKLYDIPIKSKKKKRFNKKDLNFPYGRKKRFEIRSIDDMTKEEIKYLQEFNFYLKDFDVLFDQYTNANDNSNGNGKGDDKRDDKVGCNEHRKIKDIRVKVKESNDYDKGSNIVNGSDMVSSMDVVYIKQMSDYITNELCNLINLNNEMFAFLADIEKVKYSAYLTEK